MHSFRTYTQILYPIGHILSTIIIIFPEKKSLLKVQNKKNIAFKVENIVQVKLLFLLKNGNYKSNKKIYFKNQTRTYSRKLVTKVNKNIVHAYYLSSIILVIIFFLICVAMHYYYIIVCHKIIYKLSYLHLLYSLILVPSR